MNIPSIAFTHVRTTITIATSKTWAHPVQLQLRNKLRVAFSN